MYLHIGQNIVVPEDDIIGIFDIDNTTCSIATRTFLNSAEKGGCVIYLSDDIPKSFILCVKDDCRRIYLSQLSSQTLYKRSASGVLSE